MFQCACKNVVRVRKENVGFLGKALVCQREGSDVSIAVEMVIREQQC